MKYTIRHSSIASVIHVDMESTTDRLIKYSPDYIYLDGSKQPVESPSSYPRFEDLPLKVKAAINKQFGEVFSLPLEQRDSWVKSQIPFVVEAE